MKTTLSSLTLAAGIALASPASAGGGAPAQLMPPYPYPSYCAPCLGRADVIPERPVVARRHVARHQAH
jgi:hypothetical protein